MIGAASEGAEYRAWWERRRELVPPVVGEASVKDAVPAAVAITMVDAHASAPRVRQRRVRPAYSCAPRERVPHAVLVAASMWGEDL